jgi:uncharacterized protein (TIGR02996 family)
MVADPDEDMPRLACADWFEENGEPERAEFIRLQIERSRLPRRNLARHQPDTRESTLERLHRTRWLAPVVPHVPNTYLYFERGFPERAYCEFDQFLRWDERVWDVAPVTYLMLTDYYRHSGSYRDPAEWQQVLHGVATHSGWPHLRSFELHESGLWADDIVVLLSSGHLTGLHELRICYHSAFTGFAPTLVGLSMPHLVRLALMDGSMGVAGLRLLLGWPVLDQLEALAVGQSAFGDEGVELLAASPRLRNLRELDLLQSDITDRGATALVDSPHLGRLTHLDLTANFDISARGWDLLRRRFGNAVFSVSLG